MPFTYLVKCKITNQVYYGSRTAKGCSPSDLWTTYFTSSKKVKTLIEQFGKEQFETEIRKIFSDKNDAIVWESTVLRRLNIPVKKELWLNRRIVQYNYIWDDDMRKKLSESLKGKPAWNKGLTGGTISDELKERIRASHLGVKLSEHHKKRISESNKGVSRPRNPLQPKPFFSEEARKRMSIAASNRIVTEATREKMRQKRLGWVHSPETRKKMSGKVRSEETKKRLSEAAKLRWQKEREAKNKSQ